MAFENMEMRRIFSPKKKKLAEAGGGGGWLEKAGEGCVMRSFRT